MGLENGPKDISAEPIPAKQKRKIVIADIDIEDQARDMADEKLASSKSELRGLGGFFRKIWKHNLAHEYYRQKEIAKARREIQETGNLYAGEKGTQADHENAMQAITERFTMDFEGEGDGALRAGEEKKSLDEGNTGEKTVKKSIQDLVRRYAAGNLSEEQFILEKNNLLTKEIGDVKGQKGEALFQKDSLRADNLLEIAKQIKSSIGHGKGLDALDLDFDVVVGRAKAGVETEAQFNAVDRITEKIQKSFLGRFANETTIASAVAIVYGFGVKGTTSAAQRAAKWVGPVGLGLSAGIGGAVAGIRENKRIKEERAQHIREMAKGKQIEAGSKSREEMEKFRYDTKNAGEMTSSLQAALKGLESNPGPGKLQAVLAGINEIDSRIAFSEREKVDLISFSAAKKVEQERTQMYVSLAQAKVFLKKNLGQDWAAEFKSEKELKEYLDEGKEFKIQEDFKREKTLKDEAFAKMKKRKVAGAVVKGLAVGLGVGLVAQELHAAVGGSQEGLFTPNGTHVKDQVHHFTALEYFRRYINEDMPNVDNLKLHEVAIGQSGVYKLPAGLDLSKSADGTYSIVRAGNQETIFSGIKLNPNGTLAEASREALDKKGIFAYDLPQKIDGTQSQTGVGLKDFVHDHENLFSKIKRNVWADNDSSAPDKNELKLWWGGQKGTGVDQDGNFVFNVKQMAEAGSAHSGQDWNPEDLMKEGKMKLLVSLSKDTQNQVVEIPIDVNGNAIIDPKSEIGKIAFQNVDGHAKFLGKFAEVAVADESRDGYVDILATHQGQGIENVSETIKNEAKEINKTFFNVPADYDVNWPYVIPLRGRNPLEKLKEKDKVAPKKKAAKDKKAPSGAKGKVVAGAAAAAAAALAAEELKKKQAKKTAKAAPSAAEAAPAINSDFVRAAAWHTLRKWEDSPDLTVADLEGATHEEREKKFLELTRKLWTELTVHKKPDLDANACLKLMELAGIKAGMGKVGEVKSGKIAESGVIMDTSLEQHGVIAEEDGKRLIIDHHGKESDRTTSSTKFVYETLVGMGLLRKEAYLDRFVEFVTKCDNMNFTPDEMKQVHKNYPKNLYGLSYRMKADDILELFKQGVDPMKDLPEAYLKSHKYPDPRNLGKYVPLSELAKHLAKQMKHGKESLEKLERSGFVVDTGADRFGKILIDTKKKAGEGKYYYRMDGDNKSNQLEVFLKGYGGYLVWSPGEGSFVLYTQRKMDETSLPGGLSQGFNMRGNMWMTGRPDTEEPEDLEEPQVPRKPQELTITLEEIFSKLKGKDFKIEGALKKILNFDAKGKEMLDAIDEGVLTEAVLKKTAIDLNVPLRELLTEMLKQRLGVNSEFLDKTKEIPAVKDRTAYINKIAVDLLLEHQKKLEIKKKNDIANSAKKLNRLFTGFVLSYKSIVEEARKISVTPAELTVGFINSDDKLRGQYEAQLKLIPAAEQNAKRTEKLAVTVILEDEKKRVGGKIKTEGESDILRIALEEIEVGLFEIKRLKN